MREFKVGRGRQRELTGDRAKLGEIDMIKIKLFK